MASFVSKVKQGAISVVGDLAPTLKVSLSFIILILCFVCRTRSFVSQAWSHLKRYIVYTFHMDIITGCIPSL